MNYAYSSGFYSYRTARMRRRDRAESFLQGVAGAAISIITFITVISW